MTLRVAGLSLVPAVVAMTAAGAADAVPSDARQMGVDCSVCHTAFPQLNAFGREFKLGGYTTTTQTTIQSKDAQRGVPLREPRDGFGKEIEYGMTLNNNPTIEDLWNTTPLWGFPWSSSGVAPTPGASALIQESLGQSVAGLGA